jgi:hypothetical protein
MFLQRNTASLCDMLPSAAGNNVSHGLTAERSALGYGETGFPRSGASTYFADLLDTYLRARMFLADSGSTLSKHIGGIVGWGAQKKMVRIATRWVVAFVQNPTIVWNFPESDFPTKATCALRRMLSEGYLPVAKSVFRSSPKPAFIRRATIHISPESFFGWRRWLHRIAASARAELSLPANPKLTCWMFKVFAAILAFANDSPFQCLILASSGAIFPDAVLQFRQQDFDLFPANQAVSFGPFRHFDSPFRYALHYTSVAPSSGGKY